MDASQLNTTRTAFSGSWVGWFVLGALLTLTAVTALRQYESREVEALFKAESIDAVDQLETRIKRALDDLLAVGAFYDANAQIDRTQFGRLATGLLTKDTPIQALEWAPHLPAARRREFVAQIRRTGFPHFDLTERDAQGGLIPAHWRPEYFPVTYLEPLAGNDAAFGFDLASSASRKTAMERSAITGQLLATERIKLVQEHGSQFGVLVFRPVFEGAVLPQEGLTSPHLQGFVLGVFRIGDLVEGSKKHAVHDSLQVALFDASAPPGVRLLYPAQWTVDTPEALQSGLNYTQTLSVGGRQWTVVTTPVNPHAFQARHEASAITLILGLFLSLLWSFYLRQKANHLTQAELMVRQRTTDLDRERRFSTTLFDNLGSIGLVIQRDGQIVRFNQAAVEFTGYSLEAVCSPWFWLHFSPGPEQETLRQQFEATMEGHFSMPQIACWLDHHQQQRLLNWTHSVLNDKQGAPQFLISIGVDITERHAAQSKLTTLLEEQQAILNSEVVGIAMIRDRHLVWANQAIAHMLGYTPEQMAHQPTALIYPSAADHQRFEQLAYPVIQQGRLFRTQLQFVRKDGSLGWFDISGARLRAEESIWAVVEISALKSTEEKLIRARELAEEANQAKSRFLAIMSHEIRTPMNGILGMTQLLLRDDITPAERQEFLKTILSSGQSLLGLLNDLLDLSKAESGEFTLERAPFELDEVLNQALLLFEASAQAKGVRLVMQRQPACAPSWWGDALRLRQMLFNLIGNALKFTASGTITVAVTELERETQHALLEFRVTDTGIGVAEEHLSVLFKPFSQADNSITRQYGGSGLGLSIVAQLAHRLQGNVGVESQQGKGSSFWFTVRLERCLQVQPSAAQAAHPTDPVPEGSSSCAPQTPTSSAQHDAYPAATQDQDLPQPVAQMVLLVDDNAVNRRLVQVLLSRAGHRVIEVDNGLKALEQIQAGLNPDLVLMDVQMPVMDGFTATREIRHWEQRQQRSRVPIIALTADGFAEDRTRCHEAGMDEFLTKPIHPDQLFRALAQFTGARLRSSPGASSPIGPGTGIQF